MHIHVCKCTNIKCTHVHLRTYKGLQTYKQQEPICVCMHLINYIHYKLQASIQPRFSNDIMKGCPSVGGGPTESFWKWTVCQLAVIMTPPQLGVFVTETWQALLHGILTTQNVSIAPWGVTLQLEDLIPMDQVHITSFPSSWASHRLSSQSHERVKSTMNRSPWIATDSNRWLSGCPLIITIRMSTVSQEYLPHPICPSHGFPMFDPLSVCLLGGSPNSLWSTYHDFGYDLMPCYGWKPVESAMVDSWVF